MNTRRANLNAAGTVPHKDRQQRQENSRHCHGRSLEISKRAAEPMDPPPALRALGSPTAVSRPTATPLGTDDPERRIGVAIPHGSRLHWSV